VREQEGEFVAPDPSDEIAIASTLLEQPGKRLKHLVAALVTMRVVHGFEAV
jgi:hypothetical protein